MKCGFICKMFKSIAKKVAVVFIDEYATDKNIDVLANDIAEKLHDKFGIDPKVAKLVAKNVIKETVEDLKDAINRW